MHGPPEVGYFFFQNYIYVLCNASLMYKCAGEGGHKIFLPLDRGATVLQHVEVGGHKRGAVLPIFRAPPPR